MVHKSTKVAIKSVKPEFLDPADIPKNDALDKKMTGTAILKDLESDED